MKTLKVALLMLVVLAGVSGAALYLTLFYHPQTAEQQAVNDAWQAYAREIAALGELVESAPFNENDRDAAEGYRHLARLLSSMSAQFTDHADPDYPVFLRFPNSVARIGWDNPDNPYLYAPVRGDHRYRIRGNLSRFDLVTFNVYSGVLGYTPLSEMRTISTLTSDELDADADGHFELILSATPVEGNWLKLAPDANNVIIRRLLSDWSRTDFGRWDIVNLSTFGTGAPRQTVEDTARQLRETTRMVRGVREALTLAYRVLFQLKQSPNEVPVPRLGDESLPMGDPSQATTRAMFQLADDEALVITVPDVECRFTNIQLANVWFESLDYASHQSSLNNHTTFVNGDGRIRYVISQQDPGIQNWLDTAGHNRGSLFGRWTRCQRYPNTLEAQVMPVDAVRETLPEDTRRVSADERREAIKKRQVAISRRYAG